jgi:dCMP deaminase
MGFKTTGVPLWGNYFLDIAEQVAKRATCYRASVGCVVVRDNRIVCTGYNGAPVSREDCLHKGYCYRDENNILSGTELDFCYSGGAHAEINAIVNGAKHGNKVDGCVIYITGHDFICSMCQSVILNAGIIKVVLRNREGEKKVFIPKHDFSLHPVLDVENS